MKTCLLAPAIHFLILRLQKKKKLFIISFVGENVQYNLLTLRYTMESKIVFKKKHDEIHGKKMKCICD